MFLYVKELDLREIRFNGDCKTRKILQETDRYPSENTSPKAIAIPNQPVQPVQTSQFKLASSSEPVQANHFEITI